MCQSRPPGSQWKHPGVLKRNDQAMNPEPLPGYVWLEGPKRLHAEARFLEFRDDPPS